jgi:uncharacterized protein
MRDNGNNLFGGIMGDESDLGRRAFIAISLATGAGLALHGSKAAEPARAKFLILFMPGPGWLQGKSLAEQPLREHGRYMLALYQQGVLKMAGGFGDQSGGCALIESEDDASAIDVAKRDPAVQAGTFTYRVHRWNLVDWQALIQVPN